MAPVACAACGKAAPEVPGWPEGWLGVAADGSVLYPIPGSGAFVALRNMPPSNAGNEPVCSKDCLEALRRRRTG